MSEPKARGAVGTAALGTPARQILVRCPADRAVATAAEVLLGQQFRRSTLDLAPFLGVTQYPTIIQLMESGSNVNNVLAATIGDILPIALFTRKNASVGEFSQTLLVGEQLDGQNSRLTIAHQTIAGRGVADVPLIVRNAMDQTIERFQAHGILVDPGVVIRSTELPDENPGSFTHFLRLRKAAKRAARKAR